jgi:hypothetical protein
MTMPTPKPTVASRRSRLAGTGDRLVARVRRRDRVRRDPAPAGRSWPLFAGAAAVMLLVAAGALLLGAVVLQWTCHDAKLVKTQRNQSWRLIGRAGG